MDHGAVSSSSAPQNQDDKPSLMNGYVGNPAPSVTPTGNSGPSQPPAGGNRISPSSAADPPKYEIGDLVWSKLSGYPWWPCMISLDPLLRIHTKRTAKGSWQYHCQFFGQQAERGWVVGSSTMPFDGRDAFESYSDFLIQSAKGKSQKKALMVKFEIKPVRRPAWEVAVLVAEQARELDTEKRKERYTFRYTDLQQQQQRRQQLPAQGPSPAADAQKNVSPDPFGFHEDEGLSRVSNGLPSSVSISEDGVVPPSPLLTTGRRGRGRPPGSRGRGRPPGSGTGSRGRGGGRGRGRGVAAFDRFFNTRKGLVQMEHPDWSEEQVQSYVKIEYDAVFAAKPPSSRGGGGARRGTGRPRGRPPLNPANRKRPIAPPGVGAVALGTADQSVAASRLPKKRRTMPNGHRSPSVESDTTPDPAAGVTHPGTEPVPGDPTRIQMHKHVLEVTLLSNRGPGRKDPVCAVCIKPNDTIPCKGMCKEFFHPGCVGLGVSSDNFKCQKCTTGKHECFLCSKDLPGQNVRKCSHARCGKFYHDSCLKTHPLVRRSSRDGPICPRHVCASCADDEELSQRGQLLLCALCPNSYHTGDFCLPAGSEIIAGSTIICSAHFKPLKGNSQHKHVNVNTCFHCDGGGHLICCEACPAAFHMACAKLSTVPLDSWLCHECSLGKMPRYGDILWVKCGRYRWWPCEVKHFKNLPLNIQKKKHELGEFAVFFFGSHDYLWTNRARVYRYMEEDITRSFKQLSEKGADKLFEKAIPEAVEAFKRWKYFKEQAAQKAEDSSPPNFKHIHTNMCTVPMTKSDDQVCMCRPESPCDSSACLNRGLYIECTPSTCPVGVACQNQRLQKRVYPKLEPKKSLNKGWGLICKEDIPRGGFVNEYVGEIISNEESAKRLAHAHSVGVKKFYMFTLDKNCIIDAGPKGNLCRFMNNSCEPNCLTQKWTVNGVLRIGLFALRNISAGEELTFNYHFEYSGQGREVCHCGTPSCCGILGGKPKAPEPKPVSAKDTKKAKPKRKRVKKPEGVVSEDECFRCGDGGDLVLCDRLDCPKAYHSKCLQLGSTPRGKWICPWHHCDVCGKPSNVKCQACPDSFCSAHTEDNFQTHEGYKFCKIHNTFEMDEVIEELKTKLSHATAQEDSSNASSSGEGSDVGAPSRASGKRGASETPPVTGGVGSASRPLSAIPPSSTVPPEGGKPAKRGRMVGSTNKAAKGKKHGSPTA